jgi:hypothetical protein
MSEESIGTVTESEIVEIEAELSKKLPVPMEITESGEFKSDNDIDLGRAIQRYRVAGLVPAQFTTNERAAGAILYARQLGLNPLAAWGQIALINGKYTCYGSLFTSLAQRDPNFGYDEVIFFTDKQEKICLDNKNLNEPAWGCLVRTKRKDSPFISEFYFTMEDAKKAGIIRNVWNTYPRDMLFWKAMARSYKANYPAALNGVHMFEDLKTEWEEKDVSNKADLNEV